MIVALILLVALIAVGGVLWLFDSNRSSEATDTDTPDAPTESADECCGMHITCERDSLLSGMSEKVEYYDDEELDRYAGRTVESYTSAESEEFRDILLSMPADNIAGWVRSLGLRGIELPGDVRDEIIILVFEERSRRASKTLT